MKSTDTGIKNRFDTRHAELSGKLTATETKLVAQAECNASILAENLLTIDNNIKTYCAKNTEKLACKLEKLEIGLENFVHGRVLRKDLSECELPRDQRLRQIIELDNKKLKAVKHCISQLACSTFNFIGSAGHMAKQPERSPIPQQGPLANSDSFSDEETIRMEVSGNIMRAILLLVCCLVYGNPSTKQPLQWILIRSYNDPAFGGLLMFTGFCIMQCLMQVPQGLSLLGDSSVLFEDALGSSLRVPFASCENFTMFRSFLEVHFNDRPGHRNVLRKQYHILAGDARGHTIEEEEWGTIVKPKSRITMAMLIAANNRQCPRCRKELQLSVGGYFQW